jgi:ankyrin repeat protein
VYRDSVEAVDLLPALARSRLPNREGMTPLAMAALFGNPQIVDRLIKGGADAKALGTERRVDGDVRRAERQPRP